MDRQEAMWFSLASGATTLSDLAKSNTGASPAVLGGREVGGAAHNRSQSARSDVRTEEGVHPSSRGCSSSVLPDDEDDAIPPSKKEFEPDEAPPTPSSASGGLATPSPTPSVLYDLPFVHSKEDARILAKSLTDVQREFPFAMMDGGQPPTAHAMLDSFVSRARTVLSPPKGRRVEDGWVETSPFPNRASAPASPTPSDYRHSTHQIVSTLHSESLPSTPQPAATADLGLCTTALGENTAPVSRVSTPQPPSQSLSLPQPVPRRVVVPSTAVIPCADPLAASPSSAAKWRQKMQQELAHIHSVAQSHRRNILNGDASNDCNGEERSASKTDSVQTGTLCERSLNKDNPQQEQQPRDYTAVERLPLVIPRRSHQPISLPQRCTEVDLRLKPATRSDIHLGTAVFLLEAAAVRDRMGTMWLDEIAPLCNAACLGVVTFCPSTAGKGVFVDVSFTSGSSFLVPLGCLQVKDLRESSSSKENNDQIGAGNEHEDEGSNDHVEPDEAGKELFSFDCGDSLFEVHIYGWEEEVRCAIVTSEIRSRRRLLRDAVHLHRRALVDQDSTRRLEGRRTPTVDDVLSHIPPLPRGAHHGSDLAVGDVVCLKSADVTKELCLVHSTPTEQWWSDDLAPYCGCGPVATVEELLSGGVGVGPCPRVRIARLKFLDGHVVSVPASCISLIRT